MTMRLLRDRRGASAIESAIVCPVLILLAIGTIQAGVAIARLNGLRAVAAATARCVAIGARKCTVAPADCTTSDAGICHAQRLARDIVWLTLADTAVTIAPTTIGASGGVRVTIAQPIGIAGFTTTVRVRSVAPRAE